MRPSQKWEWVALCGTVLLHSSTVQAVVLDQSSFVSYAPAGAFPQVGFVGELNPEIFPFSGPYMTQAQTFTPGITGRLEAVGIHIQSTIPEVTEPLMLAILPTQNGTPAGNISQMLAIGEVGEDYYPVQGEGITWGDTRLVDLSGFDLLLEPSKTYAIVLFSSAELPNSGPFSHYAAPFGWDGVRIAEDYTGGRAFFAVHDETGGAFSWTASYEDHDHYFQTFMAAMPIPEPNTLALMAAGLLCIGIASRWRRHIA